MVTNWIIILTHFTLEISQIWLNSAQFMHPFFITADNRFTIIDRSICVCIYVYKLYFKVEHSVIQCLLELVLISAAGHYMYDKITDHVSAFQACLLYILRSLHLRLMDSR